MRTGHEPQRRAVREDGLEPEPGLRKRLAHAGQGMPSPRRIRGVPPGLAQRFTRRYGLCRFASGAAGVRRRLRRCLRLGGRRRVLGVAAPKEVPEFREISLG